MVQCIFHLQNTKPILPWSLFSSQPSPPCSPVTPALSFLQPSCPCPLLPAAQVPLSCATLLTAGRCHLDEQTQHEQTEGQHGFRQLWGLHPLQVYRLLELWRSGVFVGDQPESSLALKERLDWVRQKWREGGEEGLADC